MGINVPWCHGLPGLAIFGSPTVIIFSPFWGWKFTKVFWVIPSHKSEIPPNGSKWAKVDWIPYWTSVSWGCCINSFRSKRYYHDIMIADSPEEAECELRDHITFSTAWDITCIFKTNLRGIFEGQTVIPIPGRYQAHLLRWTHEWLTWGSPTPINAGNGNPGCHKPIPFGDSLSSIKMVMIWGWLMALGLPNHTRFYQVIPGFWPIPIFPPCTVLL